MKERKKAPLALPGDKLAVSEEFLPGMHTYDASGLIRALRAGSVVRDMKNMEISVQPAAEPELFRVDDWVTGQVEGSQANSANVHIFFLNGKPTYKDFSGMLSLRSLSGGGRGARRTTPVKPGDIVRCRVFSLVNGIIHLTIDEPDMGVVAALCGSCGRHLLKGNATKLKCDECGNVEERKLARDFGTTPIEP
ncbi:MAG: exosome complex RNA-binding protein Csl4 [Nitrososphaerota archaeon]|jgi:exosome complex component CSL4|nr:exosome complex RNA-binding protein Csl4 [Nitrososphaerota archaeon]MDG6903246.1 exosome complex RNA-binding protein Csl4 [Nitrososphaerota archaeon]MDG6911724.1 exosome complex RNA-binding protein Csl4 [Nitrososphaerota archaeon]MDG6940626.1 exosome complex RNA-binding protein Csl4 [Nitrososphaerota archaeon]MDG6960936.1 exosome complex RNA-binding protein Csl4 [Nitrososphaerota archaeon]